MNVIILTCSCDTIVSKMCEKLCAFSANVFEPSTNNADVSLVENICICIEHIFLIGVVGCLLWKQIDHISKGISERRRRVWEKEDIDRKQRSDLLDKYLDFLKEQAKGTSLITNDNQTSESIIKIIKNCLSPEKQQTSVIDKSVINQYRKVLEYLIQLSQKGELNTVSEDKLNSLFDSPAK